MNSKSLFVKADKNYLIEDETYDVVRIELKAVSQYGNVLHYDSSVINVETNGIVDVIGPKQIALLGGQRAVWVKTKGLSGKAVVRFTSDDIETKEIEIDVKKK